MAHICNKYVQWYLISQLFTFVQATDGRAIDSGSVGGHGQESRYGDHRGCWGRLTVQPKGNPGDADCHDDRHVDGELKVGQP